MTYTYCWGVPRLTEMKLKYWNETEITERNIKIIGKHIHVYSLSKRPLNLKKKKKKIIMYRHICFKKKLFISVLIKERRYG